MTQVDFHFNVPDRSAYVCRLLRKAVYGGHRVLVLADAPDLDALDAVLWTFSPEDFVAHARVGSQPSARHAPVLLASAVPSDLPQLPRVLLHLQPEVCPAFTAFARVLEVVSLDADERAQARLRWRTYVQQGIQPHRHDLAVASADA